MRFYILKLELNGVKNIDKKIELEFYKTNFSKKFDSSKTHVKAIYGTNGAGKTAIVSAMDIYKHLVTRTDYVIISNSNEIFKNIINKNTKQFEITLTVALINSDDEIMSIFSHYICLKEQNNQFIIFEEKLSKLLGYRLNIPEKYKLIYHVKNGNIIELCKNINETDTIKNITTNLLTTQSLSLIVVKNLDKFDVSKNIDLLPPIVYLFSFAFDLNIILQDSDKNYIEVNNKLANELIAVLDYITKIEDYNDFNIDNLFFGRNIGVTSKESICISKDKFQNYSKQIKNLTKFIQIFKNDLIDIEIEKDENELFYECELILIYNDGRRINKKFESTGIKKIIELYNALCDIQKGKIVFIDEFDANIHDVLLTKLLEYIINYTKGQFVFTTHNLEPMNILENYKNSLDFLSPDIKLVSWKKNGNYKAANLYKNGYIKYSPFNIEAFNFLGTFGDDEEDE